MAAPERHHLAHSRMAVGLAATLTLLCLTYFAVVLASFHNTRSAFNPVVDTVSQYTVGTRGYLMTSAVVAVGVGLLILISALHRSFRRPSKAAESLLGMSAIAIFVGAAFPIDPHFEAQPLSEVIHDSAFMASFFFAVAAMFILAFTMKYDTSWQGFSIVSFAFAVGSLLGLVALLVMYNTGPAGRDSESLYHFLFSSGWYCYPYS